MFSWSIKKRLYYTFLNSFFDARNLFVKSTLIYYYTSNELFIKE